MAKSSFDLFSDKLDNMCDGLQKALESKVLFLSETVAGDARAACPVEHGDLQNSIEGFTAKDKDTITGGAVTTNEYAGYVEFGTGPTGTSTGGHPLDSELGIVRKTEPWIAKIPINSKTMIYLGTISEKERKKGYAIRYVHGQKANPYMYTAMKQNEKEITESFGETLKEVIKGG